MREVKEDDSDLVDEVRLLLLTEDDSRDDDESLHPILEAWFELSLTEYFLSCSRMLFIPLIFFVISVWETKIKSVQSI